MRYHYTKPSLYMSMYGKSYICNHPVYDSCTLYEMGTKGLAVIQQRFNIETKSTYWTDIDSWLTDALYLHPGLIPKMKFYLKRNSSTILTFAGAAGVVGTAVLAAKATPKAMRLLEKSTDEKGDKLTIAETIVIIGPAYIPASIIGVSTIACIFGANILNKRQQAALTSAYALLDSAYKEYRDKLIELYGKEADVKIRDSIVLQRCDYHQIDVDEPDEKLIWVDELSGNTIRRYEKEIIDAEYHFNRNFTLGGSIALNDLYEFLGMPEVEGGDEIGWSLSEGYHWIDFEHRLVSRDDGGTPIYSISTVFPPEPFDDMY